MKDFPILYENKHECCGCTACYAICPKRAITMQPDNEGFLYPTVDKDKCIKCYTCLNVCKFKKVSNMKIAILTLFNGNYNYGGFLQAYALAYVLNKMDCVAYQIKVSGGKNLIYPSRLSQCRQYSLQEIILKIQEKLIERKNTCIESRINERKKLFDLFESQNIPVGNRSYNIENIDLLGKDYDAFVVGSDQIWNPNVLNSFFALDFEVGNGRKKIAYAASIGRGALSEYEGICLKKYLKSFDSISVREQSAKNLLLAAGIENQIDIVLDPTMLIKQKDWDIVCQKRIIESKYVLLYAFSCYPYQTELKYYYESKGYRMVYIPYVKQKNNNFDWKSPLEPIWEVGPAEFLSLIKYADVVITDSFHGTVFSIIQTIFRVQT